MKRRTLIKYTADEYDVFSKWRLHLHWRAGEVKAIKRGYCRRVRKLWRKRLKDYHDR